MQLQMGNKYFAKINLRNITNANIRNYQLALDKLKKIDIVHAHVSYRAGYIAMELSEKFNVPYIITEHMGFSTFNNFIHKGKISKLVEQPLRKAKKIIAVSPSLKERIESFGFKEVITIPNVIDDEYFIPICESQNDNFVFFTLGSFKTGKGIEDLLYSIAEVKKKKNRVIFRIGGGKCLKKYKKIVRKLHIEDYIQWLGYLSRDEAKKEFQECDCFILTSHHETFGVVYVEAIACGKPIIATRCGGPEYIVTKGNGLLVEAGDIQGISDAIIYMIENKKQFNKNDIREEFMRRFSKKVVIRQIIDVYKKCLNGC